MTRTDPLEALEKLRQRFDDEARSIEIGFGNPTAIDGQWIGIEDFREWRDTIARACAELVRKPTDEAIQREWERLSLIGYSSQFAMMNRRSFYAAIGALLDGKDGDDEQR